MKSEIAVYRAKLLQSTLVNFVWQLPTPSSQVCFGFGSVFMMLYHNLHMV